MQTDRSWLGYPSLPYHLAFDICALEAHRSGHQVSVLASSAFYAREVIKRLQGTNYLHPLGNWDPMDERSGKTMGPEINWDFETICAGVEFSEKSPLVIWAEPDHRHLEQFHTLLTGNIDWISRVFVITANRSRFLLPEWKNPPDHSSLKPLGVTKTRNLLEDWGFRITGVSRIQGLVSVLYGYFAHYAMIAGRYDLADRFLARARSTLLNQKQVTSFSSLSVIHARKNNSRFAHSRA